MSLMALERKARACAFRPSHVSAMTLPPACEQLLRNRNKKTGAGVILPVGVTQWTSHKLLFFLRGCEKINDDHRGNRRHQPQAGSNNQARQPADKIGAI